MDGISADMAAVRALAADLGRVRSRLQPVMRAVTERGALNVKNDAQAIIRADTRGIFTKWYPNSITYDVTVSSGSLVEAEIGPDRHRKQGSFGRIYEFGSPTSPPMPHMVPALENEAPVYEEQLGVAVADVILGP